MPDVLLEQGGERVVAAIGAMSRIKLKLSFSYNVALVAFAEVMLVTALLPRWPEVVFELFTRKTMGAAPTGMVTKGTVAVDVEQGSLPVRANFTGVAVAVEPLTVLLIEVPAQVVVLPSRCLVVYRASSGRISVNAAVNFVPESAARTFASLGVKGALNW